MRWRAFVRSIRMLSTFSSLYVRQPRRCVFPSACAFFIAVSLRRVQGCDVARAFVGCVVAEWFSGDRGLGRVIYVANSNLNMATAFAGIFALAVIGVGLYLVTAAVEKRVLFWHESVQDGP